MKLEDCPSCYATVVPMKGRICPACNQPFGPPSDNVSLDVHDGEKLPAFCVTCRTPTERVEVVARKRAPEAEVPWWMMPFMLLNLRLLLFAARDRARVIEQTQHFRAEVPRCESCAEKAPLDVRYVDFERGRATIVAHREYRELLQMARRAGSPPPRVQGG